jgi:Zn-dependent M28 family amino/carboxypeptidase
MPKGIPGNIVSHSRAQAWETFRARGAIGMITFQGSVTVDSAFIRTGRNRLTPQLVLADRRLDSQRGNRLALNWNSARAALLFDGAPESFPKLLARADSGFPLPHFPLKVRLRSFVATIERPVTSFNVAGLRRGTDPKLRNEYVVLTAHSDHVTGRAVNGDSIYNGAMDNASGTALLLETARLLREGNVSLGRSVIFLAVTAEEKGLLGSRYYANHPTVRPNTIVANLNTDMFLPIIPFKHVLVNGLEESNLADDARSAARAVGVDAITDPEPEENRFIRSDQYSFILRGIPSISLKVGFLRDSPEHETIKKFRADRYHQPKDDLDQPVDMATAAGFTTFYLALVTAVANRPDRPTWNGDSFFRRFAPRQYTSR